MSAETFAGRASVLTPAGRGAVAVIAAEGRGAVAAVEAGFCAANGRPIAQQSRDRIILGRWTSGDHGEEVVLLRGEGDSLEVHCHGGAAAVERIVAAFATSGCKVTPWQTWFESQTTDEIAREARIALAAATTRRTAAILLHQLNGALAREVAAIEGACLQGGLTAARDRLAALLACSRAGLHLTQPWQVAIAGRPNVGKSSLINALVGYQRAIVFDQPGTTRDVLSADTAIDGWPVRLTDAAGLRETFDPLEAEGVELARRQLKQSDLVLWVLDASTLSLGADLIEAAHREMAEEGVAFVEDAVRLIVLNKVDLVEDSRSSADFHVVAVSALTGLGIDALLGAVSQRLAPYSTPYDGAVPFTARQIALLESALAAIDDGDSTAASGYLTALRTGACVP